MILYKSNTTIIYYYVECQINVIYLTFHVIIIIIINNVKRPLEKPRRRWEDNIKMDLQEVGGSCGDWMELAQDRDSWRALVGTVRNLRVPKMREIS